MARVNGLTNSLRSMITLTLIKILQYSRQRPAIVPSGGKGGALEGISEVDFGYISGH